MRFLITGGAGFIGSHLAEDLLARGHRVHVLDDLSTGSMDNIRHLKHEPRFGYTIDTCASASVVAELVDEADVVYHLAAAVGVELIVESPVRTIETNVHCTEVVLAQAAKKRKPVLIASTSEVYGKSTAFPFREDGDLVMGPSTTGRWSYACSKAIDEFLALAYWKERKLPTVVARLFNTVGPRQTGRYGMVVPTFVGQALAGRPLTVFGDGNADALLLPRRRRRDGARRAHGARRGRLRRGLQHRLAGGDLDARARRARARADRLGVRDPLVPYDEAYEAGFEDMPRRYPDVAKIEAAVGWTPTRSLDEILADVIRFQQAEAAVV